MPMKAGKKILRITSSRQDRRNFYLRRSVSRRALSTGLRSSASRLPLIVLITISATFSAFASTHSSAFCVSCGCVQHQIAAQPAIAIELMIVLKCFNWFFLSLCMACLLGSEANTLSHYVNKSRLFLKPKTQIFDFFQRHNHFAALEVERAVGVEDGIDCRLTVKFQNTFPFGFFLQVVQIGR